MIRLIVVGVLVGVYISLVIALFRAEIRLRKEQRESGLLLDFIFRLSTASYVSERGSTQAMVERGPLQGMWRRLTPAQRDQLKGSVLNDQLKKFGCV